MEQFPQATSSPAASILGSFSTCTFPRSYRKPSNAHLIVSTASPSLSRLPPPVLLDCTLDNSRAPAASLSAVIKV